MKHSRIAGSIVAWVALTQYPAFVSHAQEPEAPKTSNGWRRADDSGNQAPPAAAPSSSPNRDLVLPAGTWITMRVNDPLSSDTNRDGDIFTGTLDKPLVVQGFVVARRGQTVEGRIAGVQRAGRYKGTSRMGLELTEISLVDGQQLPVRTQLIDIAGGTSNGRDATAVATGTGLGALIGAAADGGFGAGMGAIAGAAASTVGILVTRGRPTVVYPEAALTFRTLTPLTIATENSAQAFQPVNQDDYEGPKRLERRTAPPTLYPPVYYDWGWGGWPYFYGGPSVFVYSRPWNYYGYGWGGYGWGGWGRGWGRGWGHGGRGRHR